MMRFGKTGLVIGLSLLISSKVLATVPAGLLSQRDGVTENKVTQYFDSIKNDPNLLYMFLVQMPKGGELHNHFTGATYAEDLIHYAQKDDFCINQADHSLYQTTHCPRGQKLSEVVGHPDYYRSVVQNWSMRDYVPGGISNEQHFFDTFLKFWPVVAKHSTEVLDEITNRAANNHLDYMELMFTPYDLNLASSQRDPIAVIAAQVTGNNDFAQMRMQLLRAGITGFVQKVSQRLDQLVSASRQQLGCIQQPSNSACQVQVRFLYSVMREAPPKQVFAQMLVAFEAARRDPRIVGVDILQAEDDPISLRDYNLHMQMFNYLHNLYPQVKLSLHAGELSPASVTPEALHSDIRNAVDVAHANRIGHGVDVAYETNAPQLLAEMAAKQILVEVSLTSNAKILGVTGNAHPLMLYLHSHVPVALSTDDEGVLRTDLTREFVRAVQTYNLDYSTLKTLVRNSLTYSFLPGANLWTNQQFTSVSVCSHDELGSTTPSAACARFLQNSEKAHAQWKLEGELRTFETNVITV